MARLGQVPQTLIRFLTGGLFLLACFFIVKAIMIWFNPQSAWIAPPAGATSVAGAGQQSDVPKLDYSFDPFHRDFIQDAPDFTELPPDDDVADTNLNLKLKGVIAPDQAIIEGADRKQQGYRAGDEVTNGVTLESVHLGYVILLRDGTREKLSLERTDSGLGSAPAASGVRFQGTSGRVNPGDLLSRISITPHKNENNQLIGYKIQGQPGFDIKPLGFRDGDIVTKIGSKDLTRPGIDLGTTVVSAMAEGKPTAQIMRRGRKMTIRIRTP